MAVSEERFIEIRPNSSDHKKEEPYNLTMAECLPSDLYFAISRVNGDEDYDEDDDDTPRELYFLGVIGGGGEDYDADDDEEFPYNHLSMVECLGSDLYFAIFEDNNVEGEVDYGMKKEEVCHAKASSDGKLTSGPNFEGEVAKENPKEEEEKKKKEEDVAEYVEEEEVDEEEEEDFWYGRYKICKFKRAKERSRAYYMKLIKNRSSSKH